MISSTRLTSSTILPDSWILSNSSSNDRTRFLQEFQESPEPQEKEQVIQNKSPEKAKKQEKTYAKKQEEIGKLVGNTSTDCNALLPLRFPIFREYWRTGMNNNWLPGTIPMSEDITTWKKPEGTEGALTEEERHMVLTNLSFFSPSESLIGNNVSLALMKYVNDPAARQALWRLGFEESIHNETFMYIIESLGLDESQIYSGYQTTKVIQQKCGFLQEATSALTEEKIDIDSREGRKDLLKALIAQMIMEGILFYSGFVMILNLYRLGKMKGIGEQYKYILRDESLHLEVIRTIFNQLVQNEWKKDWDEEVKSFCVQKVKEAVELEIKYAEFCLPKGVLGLRSEMFIDYVQYLADRRLEFIGLEKIYGSTNPFPWLSEMVDLTTETNFFEGRVTEYSASGLEW
jgi:ribonucleoside-diphosphate reductase beta chain